MNNNSNIQTSKRPDRHGANNPMWQRHHTTQSREKMSQAATLRNQLYRDALRNQHHVTMDEFLNANPSVKEYIKVLAQSIIKEEIDKLVWREQNQRAQIPNTWDW